MVLSHLHIFFGYDKHFRYLVATCSREKSKGWEGQRDAISHGECTWGSHPDDDDDGDDDDYDDDDDDSEGQHKL